MDGAWFCGTLSQTTNRTGRSRSLSACLHIRREIGARLSLRSLQEQTAGHQKITNMEATADSDCSFETLQLCEQQMGEIAESCEFPIRQFRSNTVSGIGSTRNNFASQRIARKSYNGWNWWRFSGIQSNGNRFYWHRNRSVRQGEHDDRCNVSIFGGKFTDSSRQDLTNIMSLQNWRRGKC